MIRCVAFLLQRWKMFISDIYVNSKNQLTFFSNDLIVQFEMSYIL